VKAALYLRVSTGEQTTENQRLELQRVAAIRGWQIVAEYEDAGISGSKGRDERPGFDQLCKAAMQNKFDVIAVWAIDRISRSLPDALAFLRDVHAANVQLYIHQQAFDTTTPTGTLMYQMIGAIAQWERTIINARIHAGIARAKASGKKWGQKPLPPEIVQQVKQLRSEGLSAPKIADKLGIGERTVWRCLKAPGLPSYLE
jgi:DNA invertase Pin-like site-specific DNA recombinase